MEGIKMKLPRRKFLHLAASAAALPALPCVASALDYPTRPVHIIVGYAPGGAADVSARLIAQWLSERLGQQFIVENRPGAGSSLATDVVVRAQPDGYTLLAASSSNAWSTALYGNLSFNFIRDIAPVAPVMREGGVMVVDGSFPAKSIPEFIEYARANPGKINFGSGGTGSGTYLYAQLFKTMTALELVHVPYRGGEPALVALLAGQVQLLFAPVTFAMPHIRSGKLRPLGVTTAARMNVLPDVPIIGEFVPGYEATAWEGIGAPRNTPPEIIEILNKQINAALVDPAFRARIAELGGEPFPNSPNDFARFVVEYTEKWGKVIRAAGIKAE
jgi:tripartite-type tricarboxylate transporter receptor subunit TctC